MPRRPLLRGYGKVPRSGCLKFPGRGVEKFPGRGVQREASTRGTVWAKRDLDFLAEFADVFRVMAANALRSLSRYWMCFLRIVPEFA